METRKTTRRRGRSRARTEDVLGRDPRQRPNYGPWQGCYNHLVELRSSLRQRQSGLTQDAVEESPTLGTHLADAGTDSYDRDLALGMLSSEQDALYEIEEALSRLRDGTYGICQLTGKRIKPSRLRAIPWTRFSAAAEKQLELEGDVRRARIGSRETVMERSAHAPEET
jgi:RNA polymerase-binding transcription factor DksA